MRREFFDDPAAPVPNRVVVAASAAVIDDQGRILLQRRADSGLWALPGGVMEMTESLPESAVREVREETGFDIEITGLVGTYTDPRHVIAYDDGEVRRQFNICFHARLLGGILSVSPESTHVQWTPPEEIDALPIHHTQHLRITHALTPKAPPHLG
ncbi:NUDIX domain-containing protein [Spiractinospora alimapuensis]|uniref:NUDIX domain-containing protein n=1 Tax=Spiractinospora alimapuensis TaxID=2820884 RepID=UPI001F252DAD|nr:NUDIX domain-containing protein [Spiractinospora alimapuensis]QVQ54435.1 NUDIX domain-containing protein [Spiractinospora alimapuensis]